MAKRKKRSKVQKRAKPQRGNSATRGKARKVAKAARGKPTKRTVARAKPKRVAVKKAAPKVVRLMKKPAVETVIVDLIEQPAPGVITVTEVEEVPAQSVDRRTPSPVIGRPAASMRGIRRGASQ